MANELERTQKSMANALTSSLDNAASIITKNYLERLESYDLIQPSEEDTDIDISSCGTFFKLSKLVLNKEENFLNKLTTIVNVASAIDCSLATIIRSDGYHIDYYFGVLSKNFRMDKMDDIKRREADVTAFKGALMGNLIGSDLEEISASDVKNFRQEIFEQPEHCYSAVSGIVALRNDEDKSMEGYVQGIENLVDALKGQKYTILMLADPVSTGEIQTIKQGYELLHTQLSTFLKSSVTLNESDSVSLAKARTDGVTESISKGISMTQSKTRSQGRSSGVNASAGFSLILTANAGVSRGKNSGTADTTGKTDTTTEVRQRNRQSTETVQSGKTSGKSLQLNYENRSVKALIDKIDKHLERLDRCESFGAFDCAAYVIAESREASLCVASNYNALMRGQESSVQSSHINSWHKPEETKIISQYLRAFVHPRFRENKNSDVIVTPASIVSGNELAIQIGLPKKSVSGVTVVPMAPFGRNVQRSEKNPLTLGNLYHMGHDEGSRSHPRKVNIDVESLSMHTFITGSTGAGKSTAVYSLLDKLMETPVNGDEKNKIKFMVIEPAKGEYKERFGYYHQVKVYGTNYKKTPLLRINPFSFPGDVHVLEHIDRLIEIFNVCWPMYAAMPAVLKDSIERAYLAAGWKLDTSECKYYIQDGQPLYPNFTDVLNQINLVMNESQYSSDSKGDYKGALCTRLKSLTNGLYGQIFTSNEIPPKELFDKNVIVDLSRTGSSETKSLIMGLLVMKLQEYRMSESSLGNQSLKHITVLEEAHNILKRTSTEQGSESSNVLGKSVEMLANSIAEMRTYGEGFIIADQAPGLMDMSVIRNTNTKIILRLPDLSDRELVGRAAGLNEEQILELSRLKTFVAAVYQNNWLEPVLCSIDTNFKKAEKFVYTGLCETEADVPAEPNSEFEIDGDVYETDDSGKIYKKNGELVPNTEYTVNGNKYCTDDRGRIISCDAVPTYTDEESRNLKDQRESGGDERQKSDDGGHLIARILGGLVSIENLVAMRRTINRGDYKKMENEISKALQEGKEVKIHIELEYNQDSERPSRIKAVYDIDGAKTEIYFDNEENSTELSEVLEDKISDEDYNSLMDELNDMQADDCPASITSVKTEYDENGNPTKVTVGVLGETSGIKTYKVYQPKGEK